MISLSTLELALRLFAAALLGGLIGLERELADQPAGLRTHILVSLGAALFTAVGAYGVAPLTGGDGRIGFDPTRVAAQVVTGIGFLGAGVIFQQGFSVRGLTTAAALWVTAAVGTAVALGYWSGGLAATAITVIALYGLKGLERGMFRRLGRRRVFVIGIAAELRMTDLAAAIERHAARASSLKLVGDDGGGHHVVASVRLPRGVTPEEIAREIEGLEGVSSVEVAS